MEAERTSKEGGVTKCAIYCRVSSEMQAEDEIPILGQVQECEAFAKSKDWEVVQVYKDEGFTGRNTDRPAFQRMLADANLKPIQKRRPQPGQIRASKHDFILSGLLWCGTHNCTITGSGNKERRCYVCE